MADHLPEDIVRAEEIDTIMSGVCDDPCAVQDVASGCSCAMAKAVVKNLQMEVVNHLGQIERLRAAADGARREADRKLALAEIDNYGLRMALENRTPEAHVHLLVEMLAEIKATVDGLSDQPVKDIIKGGLAEIDALYAANPDLRKAPSSPDPVSAAREAEPMYLIRKHGLYYRPDRAGYTKNPDEAGRYTKAAAESEASIEPGNISAIPDPGISLAAAREAALAAAIARWRSEASREPAYWDKPSAETIAMNEACAALATLEKGEG